MSKERLARLQRIVDSVEERCDEKPSQVQLTWGELRAFLAVLTAAAEFVAAAEGSGFLDAEMTESFGALADAVDRSFR